MRSFPCSGDAYKQGSHSSQHRHDPIDVHVGHRPETDDQHAHAHLESHACVSVCASVLWSLPCVTCCARLCNPDLMDGSVAEALVFEPSMLSHSVMIVAPKGNSRYATIIV